MRSTHFLKRLPTAQAIRNSRFLRPFGRHLQHHFLWQFNRRSVAGGIAVGLFIGILVPFAQIAFTAVAAILLRVNLPVAAGCTLVSNPLTLPLIYYCAYLLGSLLTGGTGATAPTLAIAAEQLAAQQAWTGQWLASLAGWAQEVGLPLLVGLAVLALVAAAGGYFLASQLWRFRTLRRWRRRHDARAARS